MSIANDPKLTQSNDYQVPQEHNSRNLANNQADTN